MQIKFQDHWLALAKGISWRFFGSAVTALVVFVFSGRWELALGVGAFEIVSKIILFYFHERMWDVIKQRWLKWPATQTANS